MPCANHHPSSDRPSPNYPECWIFKKACSMHLRPIQTGLLGVGTAIRTSAVFFFFFFFFALLLKDKKKSPRRGFRGSPVFFAKH
ncbi:hypothetical protein M0657_007184 [Pyricularia oryzae]|nr:hypothetical protein M0657_007184 [Pyricularia oryzae]